MKKVLVALVGLAMVATLSACGKPPVEEINATKQAVEAAAGEGAAKYVADDYKKVNDELNDALAEVKVQEDKWFKNFDKSKQLLATAKADAEALKAKTVTVKEELKAKAGEDLVAAQAALADATALVEKAPKGKGTAADIEQMKADVAGLEAALAEIQPLIDSGEFVAASEKAVAIKDKAAAIGAEVQAVIEKMGKKRK